MSGLVPDAVKRQIVAAAVAVVLFVFVVLLCFVALGAFALALYHRLLPDFGPESAWWISGGLFLAAALLVGAVLLWRLGGRPADGPGPAHRHGAAERAPALALEMAELLREQLPRNAVPATLLALVAGVAVGLNPQAVRGLVDSLRRKAD